MSEQNELIPTSEQAQERESEQNTTRKNRRGSLVWPLVLILIGAILLLDNLNLFDESLWDILWRFWPAIFIALGLDGLLRRKEIFGPVFAIGLGGIIILSNFGLLAWNAWATLLRLWPLLIVAVGIDIIFARRAVWLSALWVLLIFALIGGALWLADVGPLRGEALESETIRQSLGEVSQAEITIAPAVGQLYLSALTDSDDLIAGSALGGNSQWTRSDYRIQENQAFYSLQSRDAVVFPGNSAWEWDFSLTPEIPLDLETAMGAGEMRLELSELDLSDLEISQGVGNLRLELPAGDYSVEVSQAIGQMVIILPVDGQVRLEVSRAISSFTPPPGFERSGDFYYSPDFETGADTILIDLSQAIGNITVRYSK